LQQNDKYLFEELKAGNKTAFEQIFRFYYQDLCRFAMFLSLSPEDAEEIVQEMFFKLWQNHTSLTVPVAVKSYLYASVKNAVLNKHKHEKVKSAFIESNSSLEFDLDSSEIMENAESLKNIENAINQLPEKRREVFIKCKIDGLKYKDIADELGISIKTVENQMGEALKFLRQKLSGKEFIVALLLCNILINSEFVIGVFNNMIVII
jgi:RNA polymerase sigma-70 factor (ECF subfamily)